LLWRASDSSSEGYGFPWHGRHPLPGDDDANQVQRVRRSDRNWSILSIVLAHCAERFDCFWQGKLLPAKSIHKTAAADRSPGFEPAKHTQQLAPARNCCLAIENVA
jgi:hypothetical protein